MFVKKAIQTIMIDFRLNTFFKYLILDITKFGVCRWIRRTYSAIVKKEENLDGHCFIESGKYYVV